MASSVITKVGHLARIRLYSYSNCSSCKNAERVLREAGVAFEQRDLFGQPLSALEITTLFGKIGKTPGEMLSRRSVPYRSLGLADKDLDERGVIDLMAEHPALVRRPIIVVGNAVVVGFNRTALMQLLNETGESNR
jgi:Spx/MgsR family transcriptional regulator